MNDEAQTREERRRDALTRAIAGHEDRLATPCLVIDLDAVEHNVAATIRKLGSPGRWRPHVKTVKQPTIVGALLEAGVHRFKAATPAEVAMVLEAAAERALPHRIDVLLAYPAAPPQLHAMLVLRRAHPHAHLGLLSDDPDHLAALVHGIGSPQDLPSFDLWLDIDIGMHRTGSPAQCWRDADLPTCSWLRPVGLHGYDGHLRWSERERAHAGYDALCELARALPFSVEQIVTSGTHSYAHALAHPDLNEGPWSSQVSPGTIVLSDRRSTEAATDLGLRQAAFVLSRVIARAGEDRITLDAGSKALAPDCPAPGCAVLGEPDFIPLHASEEHRPLRVPSGRRPRRGCMLWLVPDHVCTTVNLHAEALYVRTDVIVGSAPILARGHRPWLGLGAFVLALSGASSSGCQAIVTEIPIQLLLPPDDPDLQRTNNVSVVLEPEGVSETVAAEGLDFALSFELPPDDTTRTLSVFLAEDDALLAWGRTPPFTYGGATQGLSLLLSRPGRLTPLDLAFAQPDADALVAPLADLGMLVLASDGSALFLDSYQFTLQSAATLDDAPAADDGVLVGAADGRVLRVAWREGIAAWRFDGFEDQWQALELGGELDARPGASVWIDPEGEVLRVYGGGESETVIELSLMGGEPRDVVEVTGLALDGPRAGATVVMLDGHPIVVGGEDPSLPLVWTLDEPLAVGDASAWVSIACTPLGADPPALLCLGGERDGSPTADGLRIERRDGVVTVEPLADLLPIPLADPRLLADDEGIYAQGEGRWFRIDRSDLALTEPPGAAPRAQGGDAALLSTGLTLLVGGRDIDGVAIDRFMVFPATLD